MYQDDELTELEATLLEAFGDPDLFLWSFLLLFCHRKKITVEDMLYSRNRDSAEKRSEFWRQMRSANKTKQRQLARMFNVKQQAISKALNS